MLICKGDVAAEDTHERIPLAHSRVHMVHKDVNRVYNKVKVSRDRPRWPKGFRLG